MIVLTDGQSNTGIEPVVAAEAAAQLGIKIYTIGIGTEGRGGILVLFQGCVQISTRTRFSGISDDDGRTIFRAGEYRSTVQGLSRNRYAWASTAEFEEFVQREEFYPPYLLAALIVLTIGVLLNEGPLRRLP